MATLEKEEEGAGFDDMSRILQVFRIARIMRIFKLARSSQGLQVRLKILESVWMFILSQAIAHTMKSSYKELSLLLLFVGMGMLIFGSLSYFVEKDAENTLFTSIPESMWWAIQTMTSVIRFSFNNFTTSYSRLVMETSSPLLWLGNLSDHVAQCLEFWLWLCQFLLWLKTLELTTWSRRKEQLLLPRSRTWLKLILQKMLPGKWR